MNTPIPTVSRRRRWPRALLVLLAIGAAVGLGVVALVGWARGGPAKVAVVSGVMFGSISGSSVANVVASGTITIPMMRRVGYDRATAAAIEATSSTGGTEADSAAGASSNIGSTGCGASQSPMPDTTSNKRSMRRRCTSASTMTACAPGCTLPLCSISPR